MTLEELKREEQNLKDQMFKNNQAQLEINKKLFIEKNGFTIGDEIKFLNNKILKFAKISGFDCTSKDVYYYFIQMQNAKGGYEQRNIRLYQSELSQAVKV